MTTKTHTKDTPSTHTARRAAAADVQTKLKVGTPGDRFENEADQAAAKVVHGNNAGRQSEMPNGKEGASIARSVSRVGVDFGKPREEKMQRQPEEEPAQAKQLGKEEKTIGSSVDKKEAGGIEQLQRQEEKQEEPVQTKLQRQEEKQEEPAQTKLQRQEEKQEEPVQTKLQRQEEKQEEPVQTKLQRQEEKQEDAAQTKQLPGKPAEKPAEKEQEKETAQAKSEPRANLRDKSTYPVINRIEPKLLASKGKGEALTDDLRTEMESRFGADFRKVRIHTDADAKQMAAEMNAQAFTSGADIYFNESRYDPESMVGKLLLAHEMTHVLQQGEAEAKLPDAKIAESNAKKNEAGPRPTDQEAIEASEATEKEKQEKAAEKLEKPDEVTLSLYEDKDLKAVPEVAKEGRGGKTPTDKLAGKKTGKPKGGKEKKGKEEESKRTEVGEYLVKTSEAQVGQKMAGLKRLSRNQRKKDDAKTKLTQTEKAVVPPAQEGVSKANASQVEKVDQTEAPKPEETNAKQELQSAMENAIPGSLEEADQFKEEGKGRVVGEQVRGVVTADTQEVQTTYREIENTPDPEPAVESEEFPEMEQAPETPQLDLGEEVIGAVQPEHTDMSEFENDSDKKMEEEGLSDEQLEMVDSGPLAEAREERKGLKETVRKTPEEVGQVEQEEKTKVQKEMKAEEADGRAQMEAERAEKLKNTQEKQKKTKGSLEQKRQEVTEKINGIYETANTTVKQKLEALEKQSLKAFDDGQAQATKVFEDNVKRRLDDFKDDRYSGLFGWARWLKDKLLGMEDLPGVKNIFDTEKADFLTNINTLVATITAENKRVVQECKDLVQKARDEIADYVDKLGPDLKKTGQEAQTDMQSKLDALDEKVNKKEEELKNKLEEKREAAIKAIEEKIESMKEDLKGALAKLAGLLLAALIKFFTWAIEKIGGSSDKIMEVINKGKAAIKKIVKSPGTFLSNLGKAVSEGFERFSTNFEKHIVGGIVEWLTGAMGGAGIKIPDKFDIKGVMDLGLQVMGLTWDILKVKLTKYIPQKLIDAAETGLDIVLQIREKGFIALWDMIVEKAEEFKTGVINSISGWAVTQIVKGAIIKLATMLNPAGAILQIAMTIYDGVMWFIENKDRIFDFIMSIFSSITEIAFGQIGKAAAFIEKALARLIPILLSFLARWLKISGVTDALKNAIKKVRDPIDKVVDKVLKFIADKAKQMFGKGKDGKKEEDKKDKTEDEKKNKEIGETILQELKKAPKKIEPYDQFRKDKEAQAENLEKKYNPKLTKPTKVKITFTPATKDMEDSDLDFHIHIGPNDTDLDGAIPVSGKPEVGLHGDLRQTTGKKNQESHHVPSKGLMHWIKNQAMAVKIDAKKRGNEQEIKSIHPWIFQIADMGPEVHDPGDELAAIAINKFTHIKKTGDPEQDKWRVHFGSETARSVLEELKKDEKLVLILKKKFYELNKLDQEEYMALVREANDSSAAPKPEETDMASTKEDDEVYLSTQFFHTELNEALAQEKTKWLDEIDQFKLGVGNVAKGAATISYTAVKKALENSKKDGTKVENDAALKELPHWSEKTWNKVDGIEKLKIF